MPRRPWSPPPHKRSEVLRKPGSPRYFTHYWDNDTWEANRGVRGSLNAIYGNQFFRRGVALGDIIYVVTVQDGKLFLGGRLQVGSRTKHEEPVVDDWKEEISAKPDTATEFNAARVIPKKTAAQLVFLSVQGPRTLTFEGTRIYHQRMRTMRELDPASAAALELLLK